MSGTLTASQVKPGVRRSKKYTTGRVCAFDTCETVISVYNKKKFCFLHAPVSYPRVRSKRTFTERAGTNLTIL